MMVLRTTAPGAAAPPRPEPTGRPLSPARAALLADMAPLRAALDAQRNAPAALPAPVLCRIDPPLPPLAPRDKLDPGKPGRPLSADHSTILDDIIARHPDASSAHLARLFTERTGRTLTKWAVCSRRNRQSSRAVPPFTTRDVAILLQEIVFAGPSAPWAQVARWFERRAGRKVAATTVGRYAIRRLGYPSRRPRGPASWPAWTDKVSVALPWVAKYVITLGSNAEPLRAVLVSSSPPAASPSPVRAKQGVHLTPASLAILDELIACFPAESVGQLAQRYTTATGRTIDRMTVWRRMPRHPERSSRSKMNPLGPQLTAILAEEIRAAGPSAPRQQVVDSFASRTGRVVSPRTVSFHALRVAAQAIGGGS